MIKSAGNIALLILLILTAISISKADRTFEYLLLDGSEPLYSIGFDTTRNWWAITKPFSDKYRLIVDGVETEAYTSISEPVFSPDGNHWASFVFNNVRWFIITEDTIMPTTGNNGGELLYSGDSQHLIYTYKDFDDETIVFRDRKFRVYNRQGKLFTSYDGSKIAFTGSRATGVVMNINGEETNIFDEIIPFGFWYDGKFLYAGRNGYRWQIYMNDEPVSDFYDNVSEPKINLRGDVAAFIGSRNNAGSVGVIISDEYYEPLETKYYDSAHDLVLHPNLPMIAFVAKYAGNEIVVFNSTEYFAGEYAGKPAFTHDGSDMYFIGCHFDCFTSINGRKYKFDTGFDVDKPIAMKPGSSTIAFCTSSSLVMYILERKEYVSGMMLDKTYIPRYNWRDNRYESLGIINNRLYLLTIVL